MHRAPSAAGRPRRNADREQRRVEVFFIGRRCRGGLDNPVLDVRSRGVTNGVGGAAEDLPAEEKIRHTPTWRAKCWIKGSTNP